MSDEPGSLERKVASAGPGGPPPLSLFGLVLHHDGRWSHEGQPILNRKLREKFDRSVVYLSAEAKYVVQVGHFRGQIDIEEAGFFVRSVDLEQGEIVTQTPWHEGKVSFSGPLGVALLAEVGAQGSDLRVTALNDYAADVPASDFAEHGVVLATHKDGEPMSIREQGPLFIVYPFDDNPDLLTETYLTRSVWQVAAIDVYDN